MSEEIPTPSEKKGEQLQQARMYIATALLIIFLIVALFLYLNKKEEGFEFFFAFSLASVVGCILFLLGEVAKFQNKYITGGGVVVSFIIIFKLASPYFNHKGPEPSNVIAQSNEQLKIRVLLKIRDQWGRMPVSRNIKVSLTNPSFRGDIINEIPNSSGIIDKEVLITDAIDDSIVYIEVFDGDKSIKTLQSKLNDFKLNRFTDIDIISKPVSAPPPHDSHAHSVPDRIIEISGTLKRRNNQPAGNVVVYSADFNEKDTTDINGKFKIMINITRHPIPDHILLLYDGINSNCKGIRDRYRNVRTEITKGVNYSFDCDE